MCGHLFQKVWTLELAFFFSYFLWTMFVDPTSNWPSTLSHYYATNMTRDKMEDNVLYSRHICPDYTVMGQWNIAYNCME